MARSGFVPRPVASSRLVVAIGLAAAIAIGSCARQTPAPQGAAAAKPAAQAPVPPPPLVLVPADVARMALVASFVIPSLERSLASGVGLIKLAAPLPLDAAGVRDMLLAQAGLPPELARHLDTTAPIAGASVAGSQVGMPLTAFSFSARSAGDVSALVAALGRTIGRRGDAIQIENAAGDRGWFLPSGKVVVFADTDEALVRAGSLALEARRAVNDDLSVVVYPEMVARAAGTTLPAALTRFQRDIEERAAAGGTKLGPEATRQAAALINYVGDAEVAELALNLDATSGAALSARLRTKSGSKLAGLARETATLSVDPALLRAASGGGEAGALLTSAYGRASLEQLNRVRGKLPAGGPKPAVTATSLVAALAEGLTGQFSAVGRAIPSASAEFIYPARDAASAARIQAALLASDKEAISLVLRAAFEGEGTSLKVTRVRRETVAKNTKALHISLAPVLAPRADPAMKKLLGPGGTEVFLAVVAGDRLAATAGSGTGPKARLAQIVTGDAPKVSANRSGAAVVKGAGGAGAGASAGAGATVADAVASAGGRSLFYFTDMRQVIALVAAAGGNARLRMLTGAMPTPMPVLGGAAGDGQGKTFTVDLTLPPSCFAGMGAVFQAAMTGR